MGIDLKRLFEKFSRKIPKPTDVASVVLFRFCFGMLMFWEISRYFYYGWVEDLFAKPQFHFQYEWFWWVIPLPGNGMHILFAALGILSLMISFGIFYRLAAILFFLGYTYVFLIDKATYNNHFYLICLLSFVLFLAPLNKSWSLDVLRGSEKHTDSIPALWLWIFRFHMGIVYFFGGIAKFDHDWVSGDATRELLLAANRGTIFQPVMEIVWVTNFYAWSGIIFDLLIPFLMLYKPIRKWAFLAAIFFHTNNYFVFQIGIFPILSILLTAMYFDPQFPRKLFPEFVKNWISTKYRKRLLSLNIEFNENYGKHSNQKINPTLKLFLIFYVLIQLILPFRHLQYPGRTSWHEEGHYFAWRMMLRQKITRLKLNVIHPQTGEERYADPRDYLNSSQYKVFAGNPGMILQFVHHLDMLVQSNAGFDPKVTAEIKVSLNGREYIELVDPDLDLSEIPLYEPSYTWIRPFVEL